MLKGIRVAAVIRVPSAVPAVATNAPSMVIMRRIWGAVDPISRCRANSRRRAAVATNSIGAGVEHRELAGESGERPYRPGERGRDRPGDAAAEQCQLGLRLRHRAQVEDHAAARYASR